MKLKPYRIVAIIGLSCIAISALSCVETTITRPDGTQETTKSPDSALVGQALTVAGQVAAAKAHSKYSPNPVNGDK